MSSSITKSIAWRTTHSTSHLLTIISLFVVLIQQLRYDVVQAATTTSSIGIEIKRSPELTIAPLGDEVLFECELNLSPEKLEWRFQAPGNSSKLVYILENIVSPLKNDPCSY